jgi:PAS domain S-box-containing protein
MRSWYKRSSVLVAFGLLLALLVANAFVMRRQLGMQIQDQSWVMHSRQVLFEAEQTESLLKDAETGQRGFLITGNRSYLVPYDSAITRIGPHIDELALMTADNPAQQERVSRLRTLTDQKLRELAYTISLYQSGNADDARAAVLSHLGKSYMDQIRKVIDQMEQEEWSLEAVRTARYQKSQRNTAASIYGTSSLAALGLVLLAYRILREMRLRAKHAREIAVREERYRVTLTGIGDGVIATDRHGIVTFLNPVSEKLTGTTFANAQGKPIREVFPIFNEFTHLPAEDPVEKVLELGCVVGLANHTVLMHSDGTLTPIEDSAAPIRDDRGNLIGVVLVFRDATKERKAQEILRKTEKLASAARLAASVAHEVNNPLAAVTNLIYLAIHAPEMPPSTAALLVQAEQELKRVSHITQQALGFHRESVTPESIQLEKLIDSVLAIYSNKFKSKNITVITDFDGCQPVHGIAGEIKQVISNLVSNAADAVGRGGTITVKVLCADSRNVLVTVEDDGPGVAPEYVDRIFEPFFTTKTDVGTGLGLWVSKEIVERHGGSITIGPGTRRNGSSGASFTVKLSLGTKPHGTPPQNNLLSRTQPVNLLDSQSSAEGPSNS